MSVAASGGFLGDLEASPSVDDRFDSQDAFAKSVLEADKQKGLWLAVQARWAALTVVAVLIIYTNPRWEVLYYHAILVCFALIGWAQLYVGKPGRSRGELLLMQLDIFLLAFTHFVPNPFRDFQWSVAMQFQFDGFEYFYILLAAAMITYSWRTILTMGAWMAVVWTGGVIWAWFQAPGFPEVSARIREAAADYPQLLEWIDPDRINIANQVQHVVVFLIVSCTLALAKRRSNMLLLNFARADRERTNLSRYFSPNVVGELAHNDEPLKRIRTQDVAVLFVDIVGFTRFADNNPPEFVIHTLREFLKLMEQEVFLHSGTLDKYLGDGLMATFGTPVAGERDAANALECGRAMIESINAWNESPARRNAQPLHASVGVHYGPAVLGDIGSSRLEFAVLGSTVNVASRLEALTRQHATQMIVSDSLAAMAARQTGGKAFDGREFERIDAQEIRGIRDAVSIWKWNGRASG